MIYIDNPIVIEIGTATTKAGFSGDDEPRRANFPSIVGRPRKLFGHYVTSSTVNDCFVGDEAYPRNRYSRMLKRTSPIPFNPNERVNWMDVEAIIHHSFYNELRVTPKEHASFFMDLPNMEGSDYAKFAEIVFEKHECPFSYLSNQCVVSLFASGYISGVVLSIGGGRNEVVAVKEWKPILTGVSRGEYGNLYKKRLGGDLLTDYLQILLAERGYDMTTFHEREIVCDIKEKLCYACADYKMELKSKEGITHEYELPDGLKMTIENESFQVPELLFNPSLANYNKFKGIHELVLQTIQNSFQEKEEIESMFKRIVCSGASTLFEGFGKRLGLEIEKLRSKMDLPFKDKCVINCPAERRFSPWIGASILSSLSTFEKKWVSKSEYEATGPSILRKKCRESIPRIDSLDTYHDNDLDERLKFLFNDHKEGKWKTFLLSRTKLFVPSSIFLLSFG